MNVPSRESKSVTQHSDINKHLDVHINQSYLRPWQTFMTYFFDKIANGYFHKKRPHHRCLRQP